MSRLLISKLQGSLLVTLTFVLLTSSQVSANQALDSKSFFSFEGRTRTYFFHIPASYDPAKATSLVIVLHTEQSNARGAIRMSGMNAKADQEGFIAVYPNGTGPSEDGTLTWNAWNCCGYASMNNVNDVGFICAMIDRLAKQYSIDPKRIYATGFSNGAMMAHRLGCELSGKIAAIGPVAGSLNREKPHPAGPVSVILFHGTGDKIVPFKSASDAALFWARWDQCKLTSRREPQGDIIRETFPGGDNKTEVALVTIQGQGHAWPGSATDVIWEFFKNHPKVDAVDNSPYGKWVREKFL